jgi:hypothetical protein
MAHNLSCWCAQIGMGEGIVTTDTMRRRYFSVPGRITRSARRFTLHLPLRWPWLDWFIAGLERHRGIVLTT